jgi:hypothetical protein
MNQELRDKIISMRNKDLEMRESLLKEGSLYDGYAEEMEAIHIRNAEELKIIIDQYGWPGKSLVGKEGATSAFWIAQHSISKPGLQRKFLVELKKAVAKGEATPNQEACLEDRILFNEGKPCKYGMLFDWDDDGNLIANVDDEALANERRAKLGLSTLSEALKKHKEEIENEGGGPPKDIKKHKQLGLEWAKRVG